MIIEILLGVPLAYVLLNLWVTKKIERAKYYKEERKALHKRVIWMVPFLGPLMLRGFWKDRGKAKMEIITKVKRKITQGGFYESHKGYPGVSVL